MQVLPRKSNRCLPSSKIAESRGLTPISSRRCGPVVAKKRSESARVQLLGVVPRHRLVAHEFTDRQKNYKGAEKDAQQDREGPLAFRHDRQRTDNACSFFPRRDIDAHDQEPQHERHLSEQAGEGDVRDPENAVNRKS